LSKPSEPAPGPTGAAPEQAQAPEALSLRDRLIGLGERSHRKSYYPELQLRLGELERFRVLLDQSQDGILLFSLPDGALLDLNAAARRLFSLDATTTPRITAFDLVPASEQRTLSEVLGRGAPEQLTVAVGGRTLELLFRPASFREGSFAVLTARDVTLRQVAERALRESERRFRALVEQAPDAIFLAELDGTVLTGNAAACQGLRCTREQLRGFNVLAGAPAARQARDGAAEGSAAPLTFGGLQQRMDGTTFPVEVRASQVEQDGRRLLLAVVRDLSERQRMEEALRRKDEELLQAQKLEAIGRLAGGIAHDFNNMLTVILGFGSAILQDLRDDDPLRPEMSEVLNAARRASDLTRQLLAFGRKQLLQPKAVDLNTIVRGTERMMRRIIGEQIRFETDLAPDTGGVYADPGQMEQALVNLVVNARDAMPAGGLLRVSTRRVAGPAGDPQATWVEAAIRDTGVGMDAATRARVFEPFFTTKALGRGTGLGLSTVYGIVRQSGGEVQVESEPGQGTTFRVLLPQAQAPAVPEAPEPQPEAPATTNRETILVVEDDAPVLRFMCDALSASGYTLLRASDAEEALRRSQEFGGAIHLLLSDVVMPAMSGPDLAGLLARQRPALKVLFISGYSDDSAALQRSLRQGMMLLSKPFNPPELLAAVRRALGRADPR
jgi:two-component system, cell cycle sensor histidine kinase and response regulator CckA